MATESAYKIQEFVAHSTEVTCLAFGSRSQVFATGGQDYKVNIWSVGNTSSLWSLGSNKSPIQSLCFDQDEQYVVSGTSNGSIKVFDLNEGRLARHLGGHQVNVTCLQYHAFGEFIVSGSSDCTMKVWDVRSKNCLQTYTGHEKEVTCVRFSPDGRWVASSSKDGQLHIWDIVAGKNLQSFKIGPSTHVTTFEFNPLELMMTTVTSSRTIKLYDLETMRPISSTPPDSSHVKAICYANDDKSICSATKDSLKLWNWDTTIKLVGSTEIPWDKISEIKTTSENKVVGGAFMSNFVSIWSLSLEDLPAPVIKSSTAIAINQTSANSDGKLPTGRNSVKLDSKAINQVTQVAGSPGEKSPARGQWGNSPISSSNLPSSPSRISNSSPINKKSQDLFAKVLSQGKSSPDRPLAISPNADRIPPPLQLPSGNSRSDNRLDNYKDGIVDIRSDYKSEYRIPDFKPDLSPDMKSDFRVESKFSSIPSSSSSSSPRLDLRPRCLDIIEGSPDLDIDLASLDEGLDIGPPPTTPPRVKWESEHAAIEMATSLGESFWRRFQEQRAKASGESGIGKDDGKMLHVTSTKDEYKVNGLGIAFNKAMNVQDKSSNSNSNDVKQGNLDSIEKLLPPSRFHEIPSSSINISSSPSVVLAAATSSSSSSSSSSKISPRESLRNSQLEANINTRNVDMRQQIDSLLSSSSIFTTTLSQRLTSLRVLRRLWGKGDIDSVIDHLSTLLDTIDDYTASSSISPIAANAAANAATSPIIQQSLEFFENIDFHRSIENTRIPNLTFDHAISFMAILNSTLRIKSIDDISRMSKLVISYHIEVVLVKVIQIYDLFSDIIKQTRAIATTGIGVGGVDLVREERIRKYKRIDNYFSKMKAKIDIYCTTMNITKDGVANQYTPGINHKLNDIIHRFQSLMK